MSVIKMQTILSVSVIAALLVTTLWVPTSEAFSTPAATSLARTGSITVPSFRPPMILAPNKLINSKSTTTTHLQMTTSTTTPPADSNDDSDSSKTSTGEGTASLTNLTFNLVKSIVGAGILGLPAGISAFGNAPSALIPAVALIAIIGGLSGYGFALIGRVCSYTGSTSYREAWSRTIGEETSLIPALVCTFKTTLATVAYSMMLADTFRSLFATVGLNLSRSSTLLSITSVVILPLCLLKNMAALAPFSLLGITGMVYTAGAMAVRYATGAYALPAGKLLAGVPATLQPVFGTVGAKGVLNPNSSILICMLSTAYMAHFNAPKFFNELKDNTVERYNKLVSMSFAISIAFFMIVSGLGFLTFGSGSSGLILNNYSNSDTLMSFSRVAVAISLVFSYPLAFAGCRDGVLDVAKVPAEKRTNGLMNTLTFGILSVITGLALTVKDLKFVLAFGGATFGNALIYVFPGLMFRRAVKDMGDKATKGLKREVNVAMGSLALGVGMGCVGAKMALKAAFT